MKISYAYNENNDLIFKSNCEDFISEFVSPYLENKEDTYLLVKWGDIKEDGSFIPGGSGYWYSKKTKFRVEVYGSIIDSPYKKYSFEKSFITKEQAYKYALERCYNTFSVTATVISPLDEKLLHISAVDKRDGYDKQKVVDKEILEISKKLKIKLMSF